MQNTKKKIWPDFLHKWHIAEDMGLPRMSRLPDVLILFETGFNFFPSFSTADTAGSCAKRKWVEKLNSSSFCHFLCCPTAIPLAGVTGWGRSCVRQEWG